MLASEGHENAVYELGGDEAIGMPELAAQISRQSGKAVEYWNLPVPQYTRALMSFGLPEGAATVDADADAGIERGDLATDSGDLRRLIGRPTRPLGESIAATLKG